MAAAVATLDLLLPDRRRPPRVRRWWSRARGQLCGCFLLCQRCRGVRTRPAARAAGPDPAANRRPRRRGATARRGQLHRTGGEPCRADQDLSRRADVVVRDRCGSRDRPATGRRTAHRGGIASARECRDRAGGTTVPRGPSCEFPPLRTSATTNTRCRRNSPASSAEQSQIDDLRNLMRDNRIVAHPAREEWATSWLVLRSPRASPWTSPMASGTSISRR